jgi:hypothetical protein
MPLFEIRTCRVESRNVEAESLDVANDIAKRMVGNDPALKLLSIVDITPKPTNEGDADGKDGQNVGTTSRTEVTS